MRSLGAFKQVLSYLHLHIVYWNIIHRVISLIGCIIIHTVCFLIRRYHSHRFALTELHSQMQMFFSCTATLAPLCSGKKHIKSSRINLWLHFFHFLKFIFCVSWEPLVLPTRFFYAPPGTPSPYLRLPDLPNLAPDVLGRTEDGGRTFEADARPAPRHEGKNCRLRGRWWVGLGTYAPWQRWQKTNVEVGIPEKTVVMSHNRGGQSLSWEICFLSIAWPIGELLWKMHVFISPKILWDLLFE